MNMISRNIGRRLLLRAAPALGLMLSLFGCGSDLPEYLNRRVFAVPTADAVADVAPVLTVGGGLKDGMATSRRAHIMHTHYNVPAALAPTRPLAVAMQLRNQAGDVIWERRQEGAEADWDVPLTGGEGTYTLTATPEPLGVVGGQEALAWAAHFELDVTMPRLVVASLLGPVNDLGERNLALQIKVDNEHGVACSDALVSVPGRDAPLSVPITQTPDGVPGGAIELVGGYLDLPEGFLGNIRVTVHCRDDAGNSTELVEPVAVTTRALMLMANVRGRRGAPIGGDPTSQVTFVKPGSVTIDFGLLDTLTAAPLSAAAVAAEQGFLRVALTEAAPVTLADLSGSGVWSQPFDSSLTVALPRDYEGQKILYASLVRRDIFSGSEVLLGSIVLSLFVDDEAPRATIVSPTQLLPPAADTVLSVRAQVKAEGAPVEGALAAEYSIDGAAWVDVPGLQTVGASEAVQTITFPYPFTAERPFRVRVRGVDAAGNTFVSPVSQALVGRAGLALGVANAERRACVSSGQPGARLAPWLAHSAVCRKREVSGQLSTSLYAPLIFQNRGQVKPQFFASTAINAGLGYQVLVNGARVAVGRIEPASAYALAPGEGYLAHFEMLPQWLDASRIEIVFDAELTNANSTTNSCYVSAQPYAAVVVQDKAQGQVLGASPFPCDLDQSLSL